MVANFSKDLMVPCGMNCGICMAYLREKDKCPGCRELDEESKISCLRCRIRNCKLRQGNFCFECDKFPCKDLKHLDKRYRTKYDMSMIDNLENIKKVGIDNFLKGELKKWTCAECGGIICVHNKKCYKVD